VLKKNIVTLVIKIGIILPKAKSKLF